jgi:hypothetical protein
LVAKRDEGGDRMGKEEEVGVSAVEREEGEVRMGGEGGVSAIEHEEGEVRMGEEKVCQLRA